MTADFTRIVQTVLISVSSESFNECRSVTSLFKRSCVDKCQYGDHRIPEGFVFDVVFASFLGTIAIDLSSKVVYS